MSFTPSEKLLKAVENQHYNKAIWLIKEHNEIDEKSYDKAFLWACKNGY